MFWFCNRNCVTWLGNNFFFSDIYVLNLLLKFISIIIIKVYFNQYIINSAYFNIFCYENLYISCRTSQLLTFLDLWSKHLLLESVWNAVVYRYLYQKAESCLTPLPSSHIFFWLFFPLKTSLLKFLWACFFWPFRFSWEKKPMS